MRVLGVVLMVGGGFFAAVGFLGDLFIDGESTAVHADPRTPVVLAPGAHPVDWVGPAKGDLPFASELDVHLRVIDGEASWEQGSADDVEAIGPRGEDRGRSPIGTVQVDEGATVSIDFDARVPTDGAPRIEVERVEEPPPRTRSAGLLIGGLAVAGIGVVLRTKGRARSESAP